MKLLTFIVAEFLGFAQLGLAFQLGGVEVLSWVSASDQVSKTKGLLQIMGLPL